MDWLYPPDSPWSTGVTPGTLFFYWGMPVVAWLTLRLLPNWREYNARKRAHGVDDEAHRLRTEARRRALGLIAAAAAVGLGGWALTVFVVRFFF